MDIFKFFIKLFVSFFFHHLNTFLVKLSQHNSQQQEMQIKSLILIALFFCIFTIVIAKPDKTITDKVFFDIEIGGVKAGRIVMGKYQTISWFLEFNLEFF